jgi:hypothetical protein
MILATLNVDGAVDCIGPLERLARLICEEAMDLEHLPILVKDIHKVRPGKEACNCRQGGTLASLSSSTLLEFLTLLAGTALAQGDVQVSCRVGTLL